QLRDVPEEARRGHQGAVQALTPSRGQVHDDDGKEPAMVTKGLLVRIEALPGKEQEVADFLESGLSLVEQEPATTTWFAIRFGPSSFGIYDAFEDESGRDAHLSGQVAAALQENTSKLFDAPSIEPVDVIAAKLPR
ncbi:MAG: hypothetical protein M3524_02670, partial [Actinomycetota bacterium]|nr:hypothetical protein [Actinomycetota bacterium]